MEHSVNYFHLLVSSSSDRVGVFEVDRFWIYFRIPLGVVSLLEERWIRERDERNRLYSSFKQALDWDGEDCLVIIRTI